MYYLSTSRLMSIPEDISVYDIQTSIFGFL